MLNFFSSEFCGVAITIRGHDASLSGRMRIIQYIHTTGKTSKQKLPGSDPSETVTIFSECMNDFTSLFVVL